MLPPSWWPTLSARKGEEGEEEGKKRRAKKEKVNKKAVNNKKRVNKGKRGMRTRESNKVNKRVWE
jgi:hypothetical protein